MQGNIIILDINSDDMFDFMEKKILWQLDFLSMHAIERIFYLTLKFFSYLLIYLALNLWVDK